MNPATTTRGAAARSQAGFSLVELMVGLVVGLIIALAITASVGAISKQLRITGSGIGAGESAQLALGILDRDIRMAGAALFGNSIDTMCPKINMYKAGVTVLDGEPIGLARSPVRIIDGGAGGADTLELLLADPVPGSHTVAVVKPMPNTSSVFKVTEPRNLLEVDDFVLVAHPPPNATDPCTLIQVTNLTGACNDKANGCQVNYNPGQSDYNPPNPNKAFTNPQTYGEGSVLIRVNSLFSPAAVTRYTVLCNALLRHDATVAPSCADASWRDSALAGDVVMLKAQYGIATNNSDQIGAWKSAADTTAEEFTRAKAIRVAVVTRSREADSTDVTASAPIVFNDGDDDNDGNDDALTLDLSATSVPAGKTWRNFRYRVHETVTPLRNIAWNR